jgi:hypothetical protein
VGRIPLKTRGRENEIADSGILLIDSGVMQKECSRLPENPEKRLIPL